MFGQFTGPGRERLPPCERANEIGAGQWIALEGDVGERGVSRRRLPPRRQGLEKVEPGPETEFRDGEASTGRPARGQVVAAEKDVTGFRTAVTARKERITEVPGKRCFVFVPIDVVHDVLVMPARDPLPPASCRPEIMIIICTDNGQECMGETFDVCIVGGGIVGLWTARLVAAGGASVVVVERDVCGAGASGGILGALMAHGPDNWNDKKQFQFEALAELGDLIGGLEDETGMTSGYARCGRLLPIRSPAFLTQAERRAAASTAHWRSDGAAYSLSVEAAADDQTWISPDVAPLGVVRDTLAARVAPVRYIAMLKAAVAPYVAIREGHTFEDFDEVGGRVTLSGGASPLTAGHLVLAAGYTSFDHIRVLTGHSIGGGVKGQAALFRCPDAAAGQPMIYDDGTYVVPHDDGHCAVGSTSEKQWQDATTPDHTQSDFIARAKQLCPPLRNAELVGRWAGVRPRCARTDPIIGRLSPKRPIYAATGGYKITFGIAHRMARRVADEILGAEQPLPIPATFRPAHHLVTADPAL